ncbi:nonribosomal peptide synthase Pes1 [Aspergillus aculeatinus CBS 121060]|uniref:Non-ribosomal peptide synthetase n=1 Tax=Aspergillus aculeatinus CBS 121060 TaxID=1448322 RepID=A0ACD1HKC7_9EURO|nr:non-ribosomal peptide synthetase [Aspergillus aculeatinus CBS 121060]RAH74069.1 non-ribosomal peptide synthetase [Aspergillus aculeatinus CBS 121060]
MAQPIPCCLPKFGNGHFGPKRPASLRTRIGGAQTRQLLSAWDQGQLDPLLQASWAILLHHYTELEEICFGYQPSTSSSSSSSSIPSSAAHNDLNDLNHLIFSLSIAEDDSLQSVLRRAEYKHHGFGDGDAERCEIASPVYSGYTLFNTILMLRDCRKPTQDARTLAMQPVLANPLPEECRVRLHVKILQDDVRIFFEYWNHDISTEHVRCVADYFEVILAHLLSATDIAVKDVSHLSDRDWARICRFNSAMPESYDRCIHEVIQEQVLVRPDSEAVCAWDGSLTYRDLDLLSSQVAYHLFAQGVRPETCVALCFDKSKWNVVAMLGVLKAGGAFVPMDPTHPLSRLQYLAGAVKADILLCSRNHTEALSEVTKTIIPLDQETIDGLPSIENAGALPQVEGRNAAYVIFTSGSTGEPKGTMLEHRAFVSSAMAHAPRLHVSSTTRILQFAAHTFDASLVDLLTTLIVGGCICIPSEEERLGDIVKVINDMKINNASLTPSFVEFLDISLVPGLEVLTLAGEAMSQAQASTWSKIRLVNGYGPTEAAVAAVINSNVTASTDCKDIGLPVGARCWVVAPHNHDQLVPVGAPGELILEGPTLARGYLNNPQKTNESFIFDPAWTKLDTTHNATRRFYKTGDLVRYNSDTGSLTYIGRKDTQVKFHGQRIELGEIESQLAADPNVKHCMTFLSKSGFSSGKLVAVFSLSVQFEGQQSSDKAPLELIDPTRKAPIVAEIRERLSTCLPTYMIPGVWLCVESLPLLASGKINRKATEKWIGEMPEDPDRQAVTLEATDTTMLPTSTTEEQIASIWSRVLNIPRAQIGMDQGFLSLGGDSIAAITCLGFCKKLGMGLGVQDVLHSRSIRELATRVKRIDQSVVYEEEVEKPFDLSPIQKLHFTVRDEGQGHFNQSVRTRINKHIPEHDLRCAVEKIISRHSMLRSRLERNNVDGGYQQRITEDVSGSYRWRAHDGVSQNRIDAAVAESQSSMNAFVGPVFAVDLFHENGVNTLLSLVSHHMVVDIVSWRIILEDLEDLLLNPDQPVSQNGSLPFQTWCRLQADQCRPSDSRTMEELPETPEPNYSYWGLQHKQTTYGDVDCETFELDAESTRAVLIDCHQTFATEPIDVLLAALLHSFGETFNDRSLPVIYNEGHGREPWDSTIDISRTVGWFTTVYPILLSALPSSDPSETVVRVKDLRRRAADNGRQEFARRVLTTRENGTSLHYSPFEMSFNYVGQHRDLQRKDGLFQLMNQMAGETGQGGGAADFGADTPRFALFEISAMVVQDNLRFIFSFNRHMQHQALIKDWVQCCRTLLQSIGRSLRSAHPKPTLSSFPLLKLSYDELDTIIAKKLPDLGVTSFEDLEDIYPCSMMQQGILLSRSRDTTLYAVHGTFEVSGLRGKPTMNRLTTAWQRVVAHHAMLRTLFLENLTSKDLFCQVVLKSYDAKPQYLRCGSEADVLFTLDAQPAPFYDHSHPHHRFTICETANGKLFCRLEFNHVVIDGNSISIILRDLQLAYQGELEEPKPKFKNYMQYLQQTSRRASIDYWRSYLTGIKPCHFPVLNDGSTSIRELRTKRLSLPFFKELRKTCEANGLTLPTAFSAAWGLTVRAFCNSDDVSFTYLASLRDVPVEGVESVVGPVINTLTCRIQFPENVLLKEVLSRVQNDNIENLPYRHLPLVDIQKALGISDSLINSGISYRKLPTSDLRARGEIRLSEVGIIHDPAESPVFINVEATDENANIELNHWTDHLSVGQAEHAASTFLKSLENIAFHIHENVRKLDNFSDLNKQQIEAWNKHMPGAVDICIHEVIEAYAKSTPDSPALIAWDGTFTYHRVDELSSLLAAYLIKLGVSPGDIVPIDFDRSGWQIIAILAISKAGGVCVPLSDDLQQSIEDWSVLDEAQVALVSPTRAQFLEGTVPYVLPVEESLFEFLPRTDVSSQSPAVPSQDGYVVFTTANSKAVVLSHRAIMTRAKFFASELGLNNKNRMFQSSPCTSDMFLQEAFGTFLAGGSICIPSNTSSEHLAREFKKLQANSISLAISAASALKPAFFNSVEVLALWGEGLTRKVADTLPKRAKVRVFYGTTESSSASIQASDFATSDDYLAIGSTVGCVPWLVDPDDSSALVPVGCVGELILEGPCLARGYLDDEEQTKESFIDSPGWSLGHDNEAGEDSEPTRWLFKTGDLARFNSDGSLVYVGKKNGGSRTDILHIEQRLSTLASINTPYAVESISKSGKQDSQDSMAVFMFHGAKANVAENQIIASMTPEFREHASKLYAQLSHQLPEDQVPRFYFQVPKMPLTSSGKLNRQLLKEAYNRLPEASRLASDIKGFNDFWKFQLANSSQPQQFPSRASSSNAYSSKFGRQTVQIAWCDAVKSLKGGLRSAILCAWALTMHGYSESDDIIFGESLMGTESSIDDAQHATIVPRRFKIDNNSTVAGLLEATESNLTAAQHYQWAGLRRIQSLNADTARACTFGSLLSVIGGNEHPGSEAVVISQDEIASFPLLVQCMLKDQDVEFAIRYDEAALNSAQVERLMAQFVACLRLLSSGKNRTETIADLSRAHEGFRTFQGGIPIWKEYLADVESCMFPILCATSSENSRAHKTLAISNASDLQAFCRNSGVTDSQLVEMAWGLTLRCYTGMEDVCFGIHVPEIGRDDAFRFADTAPLNNVIACRLKLDDNVTLEQAMQERKADSARLSHHQLPFEEIQHELGFEDAIYNTVVRSPGAPADIDLSKFVIAVEAKFTEAIGEVSFKYSTQDISNADMEGILNVFDHVLSSVIHSSLENRTIGEIDFLSEQCCQKMSEWNANLEDRPEICVHEIIQQRACANPSAPAISAWDGEFTYAELDILSTRLAEHLATMGVKSEVFVAMFFEKSAWTVIAQLAVLKAGGAFASLDPTHPTDRLSGMIEDLGTEIILCSEKYQDKAFKLCGSSFVVSRSTIEELPEPQSSQIQPANVNDPAYAIFTSGTTGKPKVTVLEHVGLSLAASGHARGLGLDSNIRVLQFSSYTFDVSVFEIMVVLANGGCVCVPSEEERINDLVGAMKRLRVNFTSTTPSIINTLDPKAIPDLATILTGGEKMPSDFLDRWSDRCIINAYGPSEGTVMNTVDFKRDRKGTLVNSDVASIGTAILGRTWIVDARDFNRLVPIGAVGELVLEGCNVARGYLHNEEKTKAVFINNPQWTNRDGLKALFPRKERMYRTGDLVRYNHDGSITFISRIDTQVKLNGVRIELGEVEQVCVRNLPDATHVAVEVVAPESKIVGKCLAAFFTVTGYSQTDEHELIVPMNDSLVEVVKQLHEAMNQSLPPAMLPKLFFPLQRMPFGSTGKIDRRKLRAMVDILPKEQLKPYAIFNLGKKNGAEVEMVGTEGALGSLWEEVLSLAPGSVTPEDNFFGLGGDSFSAMKLVGAASTRGVSLTVADIYKTPVFVDMARICGAMDSDASVGEIQPFSLLPDSITQDEVLDEVSEQCCVPKQLITDLYPCSPVQEGLLTLSIKQKGSYIARPVFQLAEDVDLDDFKAAWQQTVDEMDILRTRVVHTEAANFLQAVLAEAPITWDHAKDFDALANEGFDLTTNDGGSLTGYGIVEPEDSSERYFVWTVHHALYDGWSVSQILRRVEEVYSNSATSNLTLPYNLFINHLLQTDASASDEFWKTYLANLSSTPFPQNKTPMEDAIRVGNRHYSSVTIPRVANSLSLTVPELIRAAWALIVSVHTASGDVCFGETLMGRNTNMPGAADVAGPVLTTVPTRIVVDSDIKLVQYLQSVRQLAAEMIPHQHTGLQRIRKLNQDTASACEFQNLLVIQSDEGQLNKDIWEQKNNLTEGDFFTHPIVVECKLGQSQIAITLHHDELVFDSWQAQMLVGQFGFVLEQLLAITKEDSRKVGELEVSGPVDKKEIAAWNQRNPPCVDRCVHHIIEEKASSRPDAQAICSWDGELNYRELIHLASSFAAYLSSRGVGPETLVPICMDKSVWAVVTILGILIAGGAFVPLDPAHPTSRHQEILVEVDARVVLCSPKYQSRYSGSVKTIIPVSKDTVKAYCTLATSSTKPSSRAVPTNMAFAIFTSGSTGRAKGIIIDHKALASSGMAFGPMVHMDQDTRAFQFASLTFDAAVMEVLVTLMHGGCVCIPSEDERLNDVAGAIRRMNVSWSFLTPSIASIIEPSSVPSLKHLVCGGEKMSREVITKWAHRVRLMNGYGPTETTIFAVINTDVAAIPEPACIGYGIPCTLTWVVDPDNHDRLTPLGAVGELALEGPALAREYLKNPSKTAETFVNEPAWIKSFPSFLPAPRRIYKTGDLVKYNPDGTVHYIGRKDHQVKLHGQRMELGEIEHRLYEDARVRHAVVLLPSTGPLKQRLVTVLSLNSLTSERSIISDNACELVTKNRSTQSAYHELVAIQKNLESQLPIYMVPQAWALIKQLPMLVSGKLDRKRITAWLERLDDASYERIMQDYDNIKRGEVEEEIENEIEEADDTESSAKLLREIFSQVLNIPENKVDPNRSFVSLGGDSITGMAVISRARKQGLTLTLHGVLQSKSIRDLAQTSETKINAVKSEEKSDEHFKLSPIQDLYMQSADKFMGEARFNQSMTVRVTRKIKPEDMKQAVRAVIQQHSMFRARFSKLHGKWQQKIIDDVDASYRFRHHSVSNEKDILPLIADSQCSLDIENGPIFAADLFEVNGNQQILFLTASHMCVDMVSWRIVLQDIQEFLDSGSLSGEKPLSFQTWCSLQLEESKKRMGAIQLPFSAHRPNLSYWGMDKSANCYGQIKMEGFTLDAATTAQILDACKAVLRTETIEVVLAAVVQSFRHTFTDREVPTIYNEGHGRESWDSSIDLSRTVGWFTTMCPLHIDGSTDILDTLKHVKDTRRQISSSSRPYFAENLLHKNASDFPVPLEVLFNYLGQLQQLERDDALFKHHREALNAETFEVAGDMGPETPRFALFEITALIIKDQLQISFTYNRHMQHQPRIHGWISECKRVLQEDTLRLRESSPEPTLSDYPLLPITYQGLSNMVKSAFPKAGVDSWDDVEDVYPCSPVQEGILLSQLRDPQGYLFNVIFEVRPQNKGDKIDAKKLRKAWSMVVSRHPVLRTVFIDSNYKGGSFDQVVTKKLEDEVIEFECEDAEALGTMDAIKLRDINAKRSTKLTHQVSICTTSSGRVLFKIDMNHAIIDGGSVDLILRDLTLAYNDQLPEGSGPLFSEYIKYIKGQTQTEALDHWTRYLSGVQPCHLQLSGATNVTRTLGERFMDFTRFSELQKFCEQHSITLANLTLCAWAIVLQSCTGSDDVCFGYPSAGRDSPVPGIQDAVGIFINMLCCRVKFSHEKSLLEVAKTVQDDFMKNIPYQHCSLAQIQHELGWHGKSLFNTTLSIQNRTANKDAANRSIGFEMQKAYDPTEYPVTVNVETTKGREGVLLRYWSDSVTETQAKDLSDAIAKIFTCFIEKPSRLVADLGLHNLRPASQFTKGPLIADQLIDSYALQQFIDSRVNEIIGNMLKEGKLSVPLVQRSETRYSNGALHLKMVEASIRDPDAGENNLSDSIPSLTDDGSSSSDTERRLWDLWKSTLGLKSDNVGYRDSFFKLGGDSITAMKMVSAAREEGLQLTVADVFNNPVFEDMLAIVTPRSSPTSNAETQGENNIEKLLETEITDIPQVEQKTMMPRPVDLDVMSLQDAICPKIGVFKGGIADVLPVTDFQSLSIAATLFGSRWMLNYFFLDGNGPLDIRRLRESFLRVVDAFDILRTVFVVHRGQFYQVVLRKIHPEIIVHETEKSLDEYTDDLQKRDREQDPRQGEQYVQFYIVKQKKSDHHRILIRMSHAQFDGVCLPKIMNAIKLGYEGSTLPPVFSFSNYMRMLPGNITPAHYHHWSTILKGSKMTEIIHRTQPNTFLHIGSFAEHKKTINLPSTATGNVTLATVMQSAWAITLAKLTAQSDVVFGLTVNGRNAGVPGIETTVGPCLNMLPIRVKFREHWTGIDLFRYLQDQQIANMPYESLGFREIIRNCTDWPQSTYFTTSVFHQNVDYEGQMQLDGVDYRMGGVGVIDNFTDLTLASKSCGSEKLDVSVGYSTKGPIPSSFVRKALEMVCETVQSLIANPSVPLASPSTVRSLPSQVIHDTPRSSDTTFQLSRLNTRSKEEILIHSDILTRTWQQVLPRRTASGSHTAAAAAYQLDSSFFDLGGDVMNMAQVVWILQQEGFQVRLEDLLEHHTFLGQLAVMAEHHKQQPQPQSVDGTLPSVASPISDEERTASLIKSGSWTSLGKAVTLAKRFTKWGSVSTRK